MQDNIFRGRWHELKGKVHQKWGKLTHDDIEEINGGRKELLEKLQYRYGWHQRQAEEELKRFERTLQGERDQKISAEYESDEDTFESRKPRGKTEKYNREYFERSEEENRDSKDEDDQGFRKRKVR